MSAASIWSKAPKSVRQMPESTLATLKAATVPTTFPDVIPAGQKCKHGKWQPEAVETVRAKQWTCYECTFVCSRCNLNSVGVCDTYDCS